MAGDGDTTPTRAKGEEQPAAARSMLPPSTAASTTSLNSSAYQDARETASSASFMYSSASNASTSSVRTAIAEQPQTQSSEPAPSAVAAWPQTAEHKSLDTANDAAPPTPRANNEATVPSSSTSAESRVPTAIPGSGNASQQKEVEDAEKLPEIAPVEHSSDMPALQAAEPAILHTQSPQSSHHSTGDEEKALEALPSATGDSSALPTLSAEPPSLEYSLRTRKFAIFFFWSLILIDSIAIPLVVYFCLHYLATKHFHKGPLSDNDVFSISTACLGGISIFEYFRRFWRLWRKNSTCRVIGARRMYLDWFHWNFSIAWIFIMVELIVGTTFKHPPKRLLAMPLASLVYWFSVELIFEDLLRKYHKRAPVRISSVSKGSPMRPGLYSIVEDICAVDGSGGTAFRVRLNTRYEASHYFRQMLHRLTEFWAIGGLACATLTTILVFTIRNSEAAYSIGWTVPWIWAAIWTPITFWYVKKCLRAEKEAWARGDRGPTHTAAEHHEV